MFLFSCSEKTSSLKKSEDILQNQEQIQRADAHFEELEKEAEKSPEDLTIPETKEEAIMPDYNKKPLNLVKEKQKSIETKYPLKNGFPVWVYNPNYGGYIGAVGIAKKTEKGGYIEAERIAIILAQAELAKQISILVNSEIYTEKIRISRKDFEIYKSKLKSLSRQETSQYLKNTVVKDKWIDPKTGDLYVWVVLEK